MAYADLIEFLYAHTQPLCKFMGLELWGIDISGSQHQVVRIFVDRLVPGQSDENSDPGVSIDDCAELSRKIGLALDVEEAFKDAWTLEVSSPGFERIFFKLEQMSDYSGCDLDVALSAPLSDWPKRKKFKGIFQGVEGDNIILALDPAVRKAAEPETAIIPWSHIRRASLVHSFAMPEKPGKGKKNTNPSHALKGGLHES